mgnify:CR=1 FL=1
MVWDADPGSSLSRSLRSGVVGWIGTLVSVSPFYCIYLLSLIYAYFRSYLLHEALHKTPDDGSQHTDQPTKLIDEHEPTTTVLRRYGRARRLTEFYQLGLNYINYTYTGEPSFYEEAIAASDAEPNSTIHKVFKCFNMDKAKPSSTPLPTTIRLSERASPSTVEERKLNGKIPSHR